MSSGLRKVEMSVRLGHKIRGFRSRPSVSTSQHFIVLHSINWQVLLLHCISFYSMPSILLHYLLPLPYYLLRYPPLFSCTLSLFSLSFLYLFLLFHILILFHLIFLKIYFIILKNFRNVQEIYHKITFGKPIISGMPDLSWRRFLSSRSL